MRHAGERGRTGPWALCAPLARVHDRPVTTYEIETRVLDEVPTAALFAELSVDEMPPFFAKAFGAVASYLGRFGVGPAGMPYARYHVLGEGRFEVEAGFPATTPVAGEGEVEPSELPPGPVAVTVHLGPYEGLGAAYAALEAWLAEHGKVASGPPWEVYFSDPNTTPPAEWRTEVYQPYAES